MRILFLNILSNDVGVLINDDLSEEVLNDVTDFWEEAKKLEDIINISFVPSSDFTEEDAKTFCDLVNSLIYNKPIIIHPVSNVVNMSGNIIPERLIEGVSSFKFIEGPVDFSLLGAEFELYSNTEINDVIVSEITWNNNEKTDCDLTLKGNNNSEWCVQRNYITKEEYEKNH